MAIRGLLIGLNQTDLKRTMHKRNDVFALNETIPLLRDDTDRRLTQPAQLARNAILGNQ